MAKKGQNQSKRAADAKRKLGANQARKGRAAVPEKSSILDDKSKREIMGVSLGIFALALSFGTLLAPDALLTTAVNDGFHLLFGVGTILLPLLMLAIAVLFLLPLSRPYARERFVVGGLVFFLAFIGLYSLQVPYADHDPSILFDAATLMDAGGYVGATLAWVGITLVGKLISQIILGGAILVSAIIAGVSFTDLFAKAKTSVKDIAAPKPVDPNSPTQQFARRVLGKVEKQDVATLQDKTNLESAQTQLFSQDEDLSRCDTQAIPTGGAAALLKEAQAKIGPNKDAAPMTRKLGKQNNPRPKASAPSRIAPSSQVASTTFELPDPCLLNTSKPSAHDAKESEESLSMTARRLQETLEDFKINARVVGWVAGPTVTLFKVDLPAGVRVSRVMALENDIALALAAPGVRIFAPIPGTNYVGIEVPNNVREQVLLGDVLPAAKGGPLEVAIGKDVEGHQIVSNLAFMPHLLIAGTTGSGKSVSINAMIMSILMRATPEEVRFIMIDPKRVEFTPYNGIPHLYVPVVTEAREAASALAWGVAEMERRLKLFSQPDVSVRNIAMYNEKVKNGLKIGENEAEHLPFIVIIIDELSDLMMNVGKEVEFSISRIAQLARAAGIHLIVATQRPSTNVVTGLIKANITNRISFNVASSIDSRVILDTPGAENLIGLGDLLFSKPDYPRPARIQGCYVSEEEIERVVEMLKAQGDPEYHQEILKTNLITLGDSAPDGSGGSVEAADPLLWEAAEIIVNTGVGSTSNLQRRLQVGYSRAGRIMDMLESRGVVGPQNGSKPRDVLIDDVLELETLKAFEAQDDEF